MQSILLFFVFAIATAFCGHQLVLDIQNEAYFSQHAQDQVWRCVLPQNVSAADVHALMDRLDVWSDRLMAGRPFDVRLTAPQEQAMHLDQLGCECHVLIEDVPALMRAERQSDEEASAADEASDDLFFFKSYHAFDDLIAYVRQMVDAHPDVATFVPSIGKTHEGRDIPVVRISIMKASKSGTKVTYWFNGGIHAREWISSHTAVFLIHQLLTAYDRKDQQIQYLLEHVEFVVAPHINPDGYEYSRLHDRMWRKNRRSMNNGRAFGVDLNRNFDVKWGGVGTSGDPQSDIYRGPSAASEPEVQALQNYISGLEGAVIGIDFHSYGQLILRPYGYTLADHPKETFNKRLGDAMRDAIKDVNGKVYTSQKSAGLYPVTGGFDDWMTQQGLIGFTVELRDTGRYGFILPKDQIIPTGQEIWDAFKVSSMMVLEAASEQQ